MKEPSPNVDLYLVRHEISVMNRQPHLICGRSEDVPLDPEGERRARLLGGGLRSLNLWPDRAFSSPARRAHDTGRLALAAMGFREPLIIDEDLSEVSQGEWEGRVRSEIYKDPLVLARIAEDSLNFSALGGESNAMAGMRIDRFLNRAVAISEEQAAPQTILAFTHGYVTRIAVGQLLGWSVDEMRNERLTPNGSLTHLRYQAPGWTVEAIGKTPAELRRSMR